MGVDKSYGSGKPRSATQSRGRRRVAANQLSKRKLTNSEQFARSRKKLAASPLGQFADTLLGFALPVGKVKAAAMGLRAAGQAGKAAALESRVLAKQAGRELGPDAARDLGPSFLRPVGPALRKTSESLYPRLPSRGGDAQSLLRGQRDFRTFDKYADPLNEGAGRILPGIARKLPKPKLPRNRGGR